MRFVKHTAAFLITAVFLYLAFKGIDFNQAWEILDADRVHWLPLVAFTLISAIVMWIRGWRWKYFYRPEHEATVWGLTTANFIGFMCNNILPLRIGELVRALMGARKTRAGLSYTVSALFIERVLDSMCLIFCLILGISLAGEGLPGLIVTVGKYMKIVFAGAVVMLLVLRAWPQLLGKTVLPVARAALPERWAAKIERVLHVFTDGLLVLRDRGAMLKITALSIFHWGLIVYSYQLAFQAFSLTGLPWHACFFTLGMVGLGVAVPSSPGYVGPLHYVIIMALGTYGVEKGLAAGFAVVIHLLMFGIITIVGLILMWREGLSLTNIRRQADKTGAELETETLVSAEN